MRVRLSFSNVISLIALFIALGGASYAPFKLPRNSVGPTQLRNNVVTSGKVRNHSLRAVDFAKGQLPRGKTGKTGATGPRDRRDRREPTARRAQRRGGDEWHEQHQR